MKPYIYIISLVLFFISSCNTNEPYSIKEVASEQIVLLSLNHRKSPSKDSLSISIPNEYEITINELSINSFGIDYLIDNKYLKEGSEYVIYDKSNNKSIFSFKPYLASKKTFAIIIRENNHLISRNDAEELMNKYKIRYSVNDLKFEDTIKLVSYNHFREQNPNFLKKTRKVEDKIRIITSIKGEKKFNSRDYKINW
nr:hypothetical protein [uncultured Flavobacterium sp.]